VTESEATIGTPEMVPVFLHAVFAVAGYAVDGNTDGKFSNRSIAITEHEQGAWWQVDLGGQKNIKQIIH
jgi:hypothetical protein